MTILLWITTTLLITLTSAADIRLYGLNYSPRQGPDWAPAREKCKSPTQIFRDLQALRTLTSRIRIYSLTDCNQGKIILEIASQLQMQVWLGLWVGPEPKIFRAERKALVQLLHDNQWIKSTLVLGISVGSEALYREDVTEAQALRYLESIQELMRKAKVNDIPVTIVDIPSNLTSKILEKGDVVAGNIFPFWSQITPENTTFVPNEISKIMRRVPADKNLDFVLTETGWSSSGQSSSAMEASPAHQATSFQSFYCAIAIAQPKVAYYYFSGINDMWRLEQAGEDDSVEAGFGLFDADLKLKPQFVNLAFQCPGSNVTYTMPTEAKLFLKGDIPNSGPSHTLRSAQIWITFVIVLSSWYLF